MCGSYELVSDPSTMSQLQTSARVVAPALQCLLGTSQRASTQPARMSARAAECNGMLGSNCKIWDFGGMGF
ncbi:hypothetical protein CR513_57640, partial [Mucuna pruriens]